MRRPPSTFFGANESDGAEDVVIQPDGKIAVGGFTRSAGTNRYDLARMNADGTFDEDFGTNGMVNTNYSGQDDFAHVLAEGCEEHVPELTASGRRAMM